MVNVLGNMESLTAWEELRSKVEKEKECVVWCWSKGNDELLHVWLPVIIYAPYTPLLLRKRLREMFNCERMLIFSRRLINEKPRMMRRYIESGFGILCVSDVSPKPLEV